MARRKRTAISDRVRFNIFKRDLFKCQYCGRTPPDVVLHLDHITAVANGGTNDDENLVTSCKECNLGKGAVPLSVAPDALATQMAEAIEKHKQLAAFNRLMMDVRKEADRTANEIGVYWEDLRNPDKKGQYTFNHSRMTSARTFLKFLSVLEILEAVDIAFSRRKPLSGGRDHDTFKYFCGICWSKIRKKQEGQQ